MSAARAGAEAEVPSKEKTERFTKTSKGIEQSDLFTYYHLLNYIILITIITLLLLLDYTVYCISKV